MTLKAQLEILKNNVEIFLPENSLEERLSISIKEKRQLIIKLGFDPTAPDLHLGHSVILKKLKEFQLLGHKIIIIIGDFTARIGDPTGKNKTRPALTEEQVNKNALTYIAQLAKVIDINKVEIRHNSEWFNKLQFTDIISLLSQMTVAQMLQRTDFNNRYKNNIPISIHELLYPMLQGYDSVMINADVEMGGTDQLFNCSVGRHLQESSGKMGQIVACMPLLRGTDGSVKMSKSENNFIGLTESPNQIYGKTMSIPDLLLPDYIKLVTDFDIEEKNNLIEQLSNGNNPMIIKKSIAFNLVKQYHNEESAKEAENYFETQFQNKKLEEKSFIEFSIKNSSLNNVDEIKLLDLCKELKQSESKSQIKRLIEGGSVTVDGKKETDSYSLIYLNSLPRKVKIGKRDFFEVVF